MATTPPQTLVNVSADPALTTIYPATTQAIPPVTNATIYITDKTEYITNIINSAVAGGETDEIQFNVGDKLQGDAGLLYDMDTDTLTVAGNTVTGNLKSDHLLYANGVAYNFGGSYSNSNVASYLSSYTGNINATTVVATTFSGNFYGNGSLLTVVPGANVTGTVANATYAVTAGSTTTATTAGTVTTAAQPNITSVGTLSNLSVTATITGAIHGSANTVRQAAQPNITSVGTLSSLTSSGNITGAYIIGNGSTLTFITGSNVSGYVPTASTANTASTVTTASQPNITSVGTLTSITSSGNVTLDANAQLSVSNTTQSTSTITGAVRVVGGIASQGNIHANHVHALLTLNAGQHLFAGNNAQGSSFQSQVMVGKDTATSYVQSAMVNSADTGSADWIAYGESGSDLEGWNDLGFTGTNFNDANYTITKASDGYIFTQGMSGQGGNLVLATGDTGAVLYRDIVFATGGFLYTDEKLRISHASDSLIPYSNVGFNLGNSTQQFNNLYVANVEGSGIVRTGIYNTSNIPSPVTAGIGARAFVIDADSNTFNAPYVGGASNNMPVFSNGSGWFIG